MATLISLILSIPYIVDWITQNFGFRKSNNSLRLQTGFLQGAGIGLLGLADAPTIVKLIIVTVFCLSIISFSFMGYKIYRKTT